MTRKEFENTAFYRGQPAFCSAIIGNEIFPVKIIGVNYYESVIVMDYEGIEYTKAFRFVELKMPDPLTILREILRRMNSATGEPTACRLDPDLIEQVKKLFEDEK